MAPELTPTQQAIAEVDSRLAKQEEFDPKKHGAAGVPPQQAPGSVTELFKLHQALEARVVEMEDDVVTVATGGLNSIIARLQQLEKQVAALTAPAPVQPQQQPSTGNVAASAFANRAKDE